MKKLIQIFVFVVLPNCIVIGQTPSNFICGNDIWSDSLSISESALWNLSKDVHLGNLNYYRKFKPKSSFSNGNSYSFTGGSNCPKPQYILPVVVHVIYHSGDPATYVSESDIKNEIKLLNEAFSNYSEDTNATNTKIQFCLAKKRPDSTSFSGINYVQDNTLTDHEHRDITSLINLISYPTENYINIYIVREIVADNPSNTILGYSSMPTPLYRDKDAIVIRHDWFGKHTLGTIFNTNSSGLTLVHEMGHYLGLYHPWEGGCDIDDCSNEGDLCCDVPQVNQSSTQCVLPEASCTAGVNAQVENYMDYSPEACKKWFTPEQTELMHAILQTARKELWQPKNVNFLDLTCCQTSAYFSGANFVCIGEISVIEAYKYASATYQWWIYDQSGITAYTSSSNAIFKLETPDNLSAGMYDIKLTINFSDGSTVSSRIDKFLQIGKCEPLKSENGSWFFGDQASVRFYQDGVYRYLKPYYREQLGKTTISSLEGTASISDTSGNLLFYAGPEKSPEHAKLNIFDNLDSLIIGHILYGVNSVSQGILSVKYPGRDSTYLLFHANALDSVKRIMNYSQITHNSDGTWDVHSDSANQTINDSLINYLQVTEGITITPQCGDTSWWIVMPEYDATNDRVGIHVVELDENGVHYHSTQRFYNVGDLKASIAKFSPDGSLFSLEKNIYSFCRRTGIFELINHDTASENIYGVSFSPNSKLIYRYVGIQNGGSGHGVYMYQANPLASDFHSSKKLISYDDSLYRTLQLGPDDKIYIGNFEQQYLSVISAPNEENVGNVNECEFEVYGVPLAKDGFGGTCLSGLPNMRDAKLSEEISLDFSFIAEDCYDYKFIPNICCSDSIKWIFEDDMSCSTLRSPTHSFTTSGTFNVSLIVSGDTLTKPVTLGVDTSLFSILGPDTFCDPSQLYEYSTTNNQNFKFTWSAENSTSVTTHGNRAEIYWSDDDSLTLSITSVDDGCIGFKGIQITKDDYASIMDSIYPLQQNICKPTVVSKIESKTSDPSITYSWYQRIQGDETWNLLVGEDEYSYEPGTIDTSIEIICIYDAGCTYRASNISKINYLTAENNIQSHYMQPGNDGLGADGNIESFEGIVPVEYEWQHLIDPRDSISAWTSNVLTSKVGSDTLRYEGMSKLFTKDYNVKDIVIRRIVSYLNCVDTSNYDTLKLGEILTIHDTSFCFTGSYNVTVGSELSVDNELYNITSTWSERDWSAPVDEYTLPSLDTTYMDGAAYRTYGGSTPTHFIARNHLIFNWFEDDPIWTFADKYILYEIFASNQAPTISQQPVNDTTGFGHGTDATFYVGISNPSNEMQYQWEMSDDNIHFQPIRGKQGNTLTIVNAGECAEGYYRCKISNGCGSTTSNSASLHHEGVAVTEADFWMKDSPEDDGSEPNIPQNWANITSALYRSPDLWNRWPDSTNEIPANAEYMSNPDNFNYIKVKVRNRESGSTFGNAILRIYWSLGSTGEVWDTSWIQDGVNNRFYNKDSLTHYPLGAEITPTEGITIPDIDYLDSVTITYPWRPPNPLWYYRVVNGEHVYDFQNVICFLARIEQCAVYPYGMTFPEMYGDGNLEDNVFKNNNIVTRNTYLIDDNRGNFVIPGPVIRIPSRKSTNDTCTKTEITFNSKQPFSFTEWDLFLELDDDLMLAWAEGGYEGYGFSTEEGNVIKVLNPDFIISNIELPEGTLASIQPIFHAKNSLDSLPEITYAYDLTQFCGDTSNPIGGFTVFLDNSDGQLAENMHMYKYDSSSLSVEELPKTIDQKWSIVPNPTLGNVDLHFYNYDNGPLNIHVFNNLGQLLQSKQVEILTDRYSTSVDLSNYPPGVYYIQLVNSHKSETQKLIKQ